MKNSGWLRLWVVASVVFVPAAAYVDALPSMEKWWVVQEQNMAACSWLEDNLPSHPSGHDCQTPLLTSHAMYDYLHTTFLSFWMKEAATGIAIDALATLAIVLLVLAVSWVGRGFRSAQ